MQIPDHNSDSALMKRFLDTLSEKVSKDTRDGYERSLELLEWYMADSQQGRSVVQLSWADLEEFYGWWCMRRYPDITKTDIRHIRTTLRKFYAWLKKEKLIKKSPASAKKLKEMREAMLHILSYMQKRDEQQKKLLDRAAKELERVAPQLTHRTDVKSIVDDMKIRPREPQFLDEGYFQVTGAIGNRATLRRVGTGDEGETTEVRVDGLLKWYIKEGYILSCTIMEDTKPFIDDEGTEFMHPPLEMFAE